MQNNCSAKNPDITYKESYVDAFAMDLIRNPASHDIVLTTNLYGDILSDEAAQLVGGLGMGPATISGIITVCLNQSTEPPLISLEKISQIRLLFCFQQN